MQGLLKKALKREVYTNAEDGATFKIPAEAKRHVMPLVARAAIAGNGFGLHAKPHV
jgi:hypothetical protein